jgi:hypothetical protein
MRSITALLSLLLSTGLMLAQPFARAQTPNVTLLQANNGSPRLFDQLFYSPAMIGNPAPNQPQGVMPLWSTPDGRILAIVALGSNGGAPVFSPAPRIDPAADLKFIDVTDFVSSGVGLHLRDNLGAYASFNQGIVLAPTYAGTNSLACNPAFSFGIDSRCLAVSNRATNGAVHLGTGISAGNLDVDLSYGLSWLHAGDQQHFGSGVQPTFWDLFSGTNGSGVPTLVIPGVELESLQSSSLNAGGRWHFDENQTLDLSAAFGRIQLEVPGNATALPNLNQAALSVGVHRGDFSGVVIGHVLGPADLLNSGQRWSSLDLGISWRAPWRGVFSIGAQNMWSSGNLPAMVEPSAHEPDMSQSRVPYVQYHQDL